MNIKGSITLNHIGSKSAQKHLAIGIWFYQRNIKRNQWTVLLDSRALLS